MTKTSKTALPKMLCVIAANYAAALAFAYSRGYHFSRIFYVDRREKLMGLRGVTVFVVSGAEIRPDYADLIQEAKIRGLTIETTKGEVPAKEKAMNDAQTIEAGNSLPPPLGSPFEVPPFDPPSSGAITFIWWSWHPRYPRWSQSCFRAASIEDARRYLTDPTTKLQYYHNKLIQHDGVRLVEVLDVPCPRLDIWWDIKRQMDDEENTSRERL